MPVRYAVVAALCVLSVSAARAQAPSPNQPVDISGVYMLRGAAPSVGVKTVDGDDPPFRPEAKALYDQRIALENTAHPWADSETYCISAGMPRLSVSMAPYPIQILQTPGQVTMIYEALNTVRIIRLNRGHIDDPEISWNGDSVGHWEGDTLVVDTIALNGKGTIDKRGMPMSDAMHVTERIRKVDENTLENLVTMDDPKTYTKPWTVRTRFVREPADVEILEYVCEDNRTVMDDQGRQSYQFGPPAR